MLNGLDPKSLTTQKQEVVNILSSLKFIQKFDDEVDEAIYILR